MTTEEEDDQRTPGKAIWRKQAQLEEDEGGSTEQRWKWNKVESDRRFIGSYMAQVKSSYGKFYLETNHRVSAITVDRRDP